MKLRLLSPLKNLLRPYFFIACTGLLAFAPVSFMLRSLKNDVVSLEYPINYFMSQCIRNGEIPYWFNTWAMGFPLQSNLTWGIFSTPQMLFCSIFNYNMFTLHIEFMLFVLMAGWGMYHLLKKYFIKEENIAVILACCYMLSGFIIGSGQWMLYITAAAFIPIVLTSLLQLLKSPSFQHALLFSVLYFMMFTSVYVAFNIITTYCLLIFTICYILKERVERREKIIQIRYLILTGLITSLLCLPCILSTAEVLKYIDRSNPISDNTSFFYSNYLHPFGLSSMLFPFSSVKMSFPNTEGSMLHTYLGLFALLALPIAFLQKLKEKNWLSYIILFSAIFFLFVSFGPLLPLRKALNILPGFSYFRHPAIFRFYFIFFLIIYMGITLRNIGWKEIFNLKNGANSLVLRFSFLILSLLCLTVLIAKFDSGKTLSFTSLSQLIKNITYSQTIFISALIQLILLSALFYFSILKRYHLIKILFAVELIINSLLCNPYFVVSSYPPSKVNSIFHAVDKFPVQSTAVDSVTATYIDEKLNKWNNVNVFRKQVSTNPAYRGPLILNNFSLFADDTLNEIQEFNHHLVFAGNNFSTENNQLQIIKQKPTHISIRANLTDATAITAMQNYYPGWKAYYNNQYVEFTHLDKPGLTIAAPKGSGVIDFIYSNKYVWMSALFLHAFVLIFFISYLYKKIKKVSIRSSIPSLV